MRTNYLFLEKEEREHFDKMAKIYDQNYGYNEAFTKRKIHRKANHFLSLLKKHKLDNKVGVLEIGCGTGAYTGLVANKLKKTKVVAIDISPKIINIAKLKTKGIRNISYKVKSVYNTGLKDNSVDVIFGFYVLHHLAIKKAVKELDRILKPGGVIFFCEPNLLNPIVYLIKSNKFLKKIVGDSLEEWAVNPLKIGNYFPKYEIINVLTSEYIFPVKFLPYRWILKIDSISQYFRYIPIVKLLGGSVQMFVRKPKI